MADTHIEKFSNEEVLMTLNVLGYTCEDGWAAHCLETDLVGYGEDFSEAISELSELTHIQISFAVFKNEKALLDSPAPLDIWTKYQIIRNSMLQNYTTDFTPPTDSRIGVIPIPLHPQGGEFRVDAC